jgi:hypothetical protein
MGKGGKDKGRKGRKGASPFYKFRIAKHPFFLSSRFLLKT